MMLSRPIALTVMTLLSLTSTMALGQFDGSIGLYGDAAGTSNQLFAPMNEETTFYVLAKPSPSQTKGDMNGAEFRIKGAPSTGLFLSAEPSSWATIVVGDPFSDESQPPGSRGGAYLASLGCQARDANGVVLLYTVTLINLGTTASVLLELDAKDPPSNLANAFPLLNACNGPVFTPYQVGTSSLQINVPLAVESKAWGGVKRLFK